jgi:hypothetical protein
VSVPAFVTDDGDELARSFADLVEWRDALYAKHRRPRG